MKSIFFILLSLISSCLFSQAKLGMSPSFTLTPVTTTLNPFYTTTYGTVVTVKSWVKNKGTTTYTATFAALKVNADTLGHIGSPLLSSQTYSALVTLLPGDSILSTQNFTVSPTYFKVGGGGTTVIVWPKSGSTIILDSLRFNVYVNYSTEIYELDRIAFSLFPNPSHDVLFIKPNDEIAIDQIAIYDLLNREIKRPSVESEINVTDLQPGLYWLAISSRNYTRRFKFFKE